MARIAPLNLKLDVNIETKLISSDILSIMVDKVNQACKHQHWQIKKVKKIDKNQYITILWRNKPTDEKQQM